MSATEIVKTFITALQSGDMEVAANFMSDDFVVRGWTPYPLDKAKFLATQSALLDAMPDFSYNLSDVHKAGNEVEALIQVTGTQTGDLALPMHGMPPFPATGLAVDLPQVQTKFVLKDNKVSEMNVESVPGGGLAGLLQQIVTELPVAPRLDEEFQPGF